MWYIPGKTCYYHYYFFIFFSTSFWNSGLLSLKCSLLNPRLHVNFISHFLSLFYDTNINYIYTFTESTCTQDKDLTSVIAKWSTEHPFFIYKYFLVNVASEPVKNNIYIFNIFSIFFNKRKSSKLGCRMENSINYILKPQ